jgi:hypothetical protein
MRTLGFCLLLVALAGCATIDRPTPLTGAELVFLAKSGKTAPEIIEQLKRSDTVLPLQASDILALHDAGVQKEVLDYLQRAQLDEIRWRERNSQMFWHGPTYRGFGSWPWPPANFMRPYRGPWGS